MARRRLEAAIRAGKVIQQEASISYTHIDQQIKYTYDRDRDGVYSLQFAYDGSKLAVGFGDGTIETIEANSGQRIATLRTGGPRSMAVMVLRYHPKLEDVVVAGTCDGTVLIQTESVCRELLQEPKNEINCLDFSRDGDRFATAGRDMRIRVYDVETVQNLTTYEGNYQNTHFSETAVGHSQRIFALKYHPDDVHVFISAGWDNTLRIWDARTATGLQRTIPGPHISGDGLDIRGAQILTASWVQTDALQLWDYRKGTLLQNLPITVNSGDSIDESSSADELLMSDSYSNLGGSVNVVGPAGDRQDLQVSGRGAYLYCGQFCTSDVVVAGGSGTKSVQLISAHSAQMLSEVKFGRPVYAVDSSQNGRLVAVGGAGTTVMISHIS